VRSEAKRLLKNEENMQIYPNAVEDVDGNSKENTE
jgi:hypothetical protein